MKFRLDLHQVIIYIIIWQRVWIQPPEINNECSKKLWQGIFCELPSILHQVIHYEPPIWVQCYYHRRQIAVSCIILKSSLTNNKFVNFITKLVKKPKVKSLNADSASQHKKIHVLGTLLEIIPTSVFNLIFECFILDSLRSLNFLIKPLFFNLTSIVRIKGVEFVLNNI